MKSKLILVELPAQEPPQTPRRRGRPRTVSIESDTMTEIQHHEEAKIEIPIVEPHVEITPKRRGRPKKLVV